MKIEEITNNEHNILKERIAKRLKENKKFEEIIESHIFDEEFMNRQIARLEAVHSLATAVNKAGKSKEYRKIIRANVPDDASIEQYVSFIEAHRKEIMDVCGL